MSLASTLPPHGVKGTQTATPVRTEIIVGPQAKYRLSVRGDDIYHIQALNINSLPRPSEHLDLHPDAMKNFQKGVNIPSKYTITSMDKPFFSLNNEILTLFKGKFSNDHKRLASLCDHI